LFDARVRELVGSLLRGPAARFGRAGISPDHLTIAGFVLACAAASLVASGRVWLGIALWLASRLLDALDGLVARASSRATPFGGYLDITLDMTAYSLMAVGFALIHPDHRVAWLLVLVGYVLCITSTAVLSSFLERQRTPVADNDRALQFTPGLAEAGETTVVYLLLAAAPSLAGAIVWVWVALLFATGVQRTLAARRLLRG